MNPHVPDAEAAYASLRASVAAALAAHPGRRVHLIGIHSGGAWVAQRLHADLALDTPLGSLSSAFHRDDYGQAGRGLPADMKSTDLPFEIRDAHLLLEAAGLMLHAADGRAQRLPDSLTRDLAGTNLLAEIESQLFSDIVMRNTGVKHLYPDIFSVPDDTIELSATSGPTAPLTFGTLAALRVANSAGYVGGTFYGNIGDYRDARGVLNPNGKGNASEIIGGTEGADRIDAMGGNDAVWGEGGDDTIEGNLGADFLHGGAGAFQPAHAWRAQALGRPAPGYPARAARGHRGVKEPRNTPRSKG